MRKLLALLALLALLGVSSAAQAAPLLDFNMGVPTAGTITKAAGVSPLVGTGIQVDNVTGQDTPLNNLVVQALAAGAMNFTTGNVTGGTATQWDFGAGPANGFTLTGTVPGIPAAASPLLSGTIQSATVQLSAGDFKVVIAAFVNTVDAGLAAFYGLPGGSSSPWNGNFNLSFHGTGTPGVNGAGALTSTGLLSGDIVTSPVPEPASILLLSIGAAGFAGYGWRKRRISRLAVA